MTTITAQMILSSDHAQVPGLRLSTILLRYPRPIHAELMTHRVFSRNAASSRAIPISKLIADVENNPFVPLVWGSNQKGMQAGAEIDTVVFAPVPMDFGGPRLELVQSKGRTPVEAWLNARDLAVMSARAFSAAGYHKQIVNRLLEPFAHITVLVSSTNWSNFLALRDHPAAEPHIAMLAREVRRELEKPVMQTLTNTEWHLPFTGLWKDIENVDDAIKLSAACCASTSYKTVDGFAMTKEKAIEIHDKLFADVPVHASPAEHVAQADFYHDGDWFSPEAHRNFTGFKQYRAEIPNDTM